ncbi:hypothetical protein HY374_02795 [Candidatus Berkelbacteria bacterium]|nr:hypothetical protein [Candidatus Berkelbacteria bacterium]
MKQLLLVLMMLFTAGCGTSAPTTTTTPTDQSRATAETPQPLATVQLAPGVTASAPNIVIVDDTPLEVQCEILMLLGDGRCWRAKTLSIDRLSGTNDLRVLAPLPTLLDQTVYLYFVAPNNEGGLDRQFCEATVLQERRTMEESHLLLSEVTVSNRDQLLGSLPNWTTDLFAGRPADDLALPPNGVDYGELAEFLKAHSLCAVALDPNEARSVLESLTIEHLTGPKFSTNLLDGWSWTVRLEDGRTACLFRANEQADHPSACRLVLRERWMGNQQAIGQYGAASWPGALTVVQYSSDTSAGDRGWSSENVGLPAPTNSI